MDIEFRLLETITNKFSDENKVGSGPYGDVYKGLYNGKEIAVKKLRALQGLDDKAFDSEFRSLNKVKHENIVQLLGYCYQVVKKYVPYEDDLVMVVKMERILCFEYMEGGSLDKHIEDESCRLDWHTCYQIIKGTCDGLNHLHGAYEKRIFHLDLKPSNILLDKNYRIAKIADLGLSRLVASTETHKTQIVNIKGTLGYMPPEYIHGGYISKKYDVFSLGDIILKIMIGNKGHSRCYKMSPEQFTKHVIENWERRLQGTSGYSSQQKDILQVKKCIEIAVKCVEKDRSKRPLIKDIVHQLEELEAKIKEMSTDLFGQTTSNSRVIAVDPAIELRFLFEARKDISTCMQLTNQTDGLVAFRVITDQAKYSAQPSKGIMEPCSKWYISVTLRAQDEAPLNMRCDDMFLVQSIALSKEHVSDGIAEDEDMARPAVGMLRLPIVYVTMDQFQLYSNHSDDLIGQEAINPMKNAQAPMMCYLKGSMKSLVDKLTEPENRLLFEELHDDLMTLKKDFYDKLINNSQQVANSQVKVWIKQVREVVFNIEDWIDGKSDTNVGDQTQREEKIKEFITLIQEACQRCVRYGLLVKAGTHIAGRALAPRKFVVDDSPLLLGNKACDVVGLGGPKKVLKEHLLDEQKKLKVVSILGTGGLGKTTLAKELHGELQAKFSCGAFVYIGPNPSVWTILVNILHQIMSSSDRKVYFKDPPKRDNDDFLPPREREHGVILEKHLDEQHVISLLWGHLSEKGYFIVLDGIWSIRHWRAISGALPDNNLGSRILTTSRIMDVAESCSPGRTDVVYHMEALSKVESMRLFSGEEGRPADGEILEMCRGIPLAIILMAGARKCDELVGPKMPGESILSSLNQYSTSEGMTKILYMIYADLSLPVRSCFLYLSVFPEGYTIKKNRLIQLWGAEGFIPEETESNNGGTREQLWETGDSYFNELISRRLIQPVFRQDDYEAVGCTVHVVILDFIRSLSREENFATIASELCSGPFSSDTIRRFSVDFSDEDEARVVASSKVYLSNMRSLIVFRDVEGMFSVPSYSPTEILPSTSENCASPSVPVNLIPDFKLTRVLDLLPDFRLMRVLDIEDTQNLENRHLIGIGGLVLLRYLGIGGTGIDQLPEEIGKLMQLETLDLRLKRLPASIVNLQKLMYLHLDMYFAGKDMPTELQELDKVTNLLRCWNRLRRLGLTLDARYLTKTVPQRVASFFEEVFRSKLQSLCLHFRFGPDELPPLLVDSWNKVASPPAAKFEPRRFELIISGIDLNGFPHKMESLLHLTHLRIKLFSVDDEVFRILGGLPKLVLLNLSSAYSPPHQERFLITEDTFRRLKAAFFKGQMRLLFQQRAMPRLQVLSFYKGKGHSYAGIEQLNCLRRVHAIINCHGATHLDVKTWETGIRRQVSRNPNKPALEFIRAYEDTMSYE